MDFQEIERLRTNKEKAIQEFHKMRCSGKFRGLFCDCDYHFNNMLAFRKVYDGWLS